MQDPRRRAAGAQVEIPGFGKVCRHSLAFCSGCLWGVGGFDGQDTLHRTFCIDVEALGQLTATSHTPNPHTFKAPHTFQAPLNATSPPPSKPPTAARHPASPPAGVGGAGNEREGSETVKAPALPGAVPSKEANKGGEDGGSEGLLSKEGDGRKGDTGGREGVTEVQEGGLGWRQLLRKATGLLSVSRLKTSQGEASSNGRVPETANGKATTTSSDAAALPSALPEPPSRAAPETLAMDMPSLADFERRRRESQESLRASHEGEPLRGLGNSEIAGETLEVLTERENNLANERALDLQAGAEGGGGMGGDPTPPVSPARPAAMSGEELQSIISRVKSGELVLSTPKLALASRLIACSIAQVCCPQ